MNDQIDLLAQSLADVKAMIADPKMLALILGPSILVLLIAISLAIAVMVRRRKDRAKIEESISADQQPTPQVAAEKAPTQEARREAPASSEPAEVIEIKDLNRDNWLKKLSHGLSRTRNHLKDNLTSLLTGERPLDQDLLDDIHEALFKADLGVKTTDHLVSYLKKNFSSDEKPTWENVRHYLKDEIARLLANPDQPINRPEQGPWVVLVVGVNGVGKTTTIAKLAASFLAEDKTVLMAAADTYRAAAIDQLQEWGKRLGVGVVAKAQGADPASVAFDAVKAAKARSADILLIDTAGRLHSKKELMDELGKIKRVISRELPQAPHETWLVIDATTGQNAIMQIKAFLEVVSISGLIVTKLDGTAKGGVVIGATDQFNLPIRYVGVGEKASDLRPFNPTDYAESLF